MIESYPCSGSPSKICCRGTRSTANFTAAPHLANRRHRVRLACQMAPIIRHDKHIINDRANSSITYPCSHGISSLVFAGTAIVTTYPAGLSRSRGWRNMRIGRPQLFKRGERPPDNGRQHVPWLHRVCVKRDEQRLAGNDIWRRQPVDNAKIFRRIIVPTADGNSVSPGWTVWVNICTASVMP